MRRSTRHYLLAAALPLAGIAAAWGRRRLGRVEVTGDSMRPTLAPGDRLLVVRNRRARVGDVVAVADPRLPARTLVKRVAARDGHALTVLGDNASASTDSRILGPVAPASIRGRAVYRYFPDSRRGRL